MTETSGYNDPGSYDAATVAAATARTMKRGYQQGYLNSLAVTQNSPTAMNVLVATGGAWVEGTWYINDAVKTMTIDAAHASLDRIDLVVVRRSGTTSTVLAVLKGTASASPSAPTLTKTLSTYELALAQVSIVHGTAAITTAMITDKRLSTDCGPVASEMGYFTIDAATGNMAAGSKRITTLADPTSDQDADTKAARNAAITAAGFAPLASPTFTGTPLITTTPTLGDDSHKIPDTAFVQDAIGTWTDYTATWTWSGGPPTGQVKTGRYLQIGKTVIFSCSMACTSAYCNPTAVSLPVNAGASAAKTGVTTVVSSGTADDHAGVGYILPGGSTVVLEDFSASGTGDTKTYFITAIYEGA